MAIDWSKPIELLDQGTAPASIEKVELLKNNCPGRYSYLCWIEKRNYCLRFDELGDCETYLPIFLRNVPEPVKTQEVWVNVFVDEKGRLDCGASFPVKFWSAPGENLVGLNKIILRAEFDE